MLSQEFSAKGFCYIDSNHYLNSENSSSIHDLKKLFEVELQEDGYEFRKRAYLKLRWDRLKGEIYAPQNQVYYQSALANQVDGGKERQFKIINEDALHICTRDNITQFICANEYTCPNYDYTNGSVLGSITLDDNNPLSARLIQFAKKSLKILGVKNLINHMELFLTKDNEIVFLEVSARPPGGLVNLMHKTNFGINLVDEDFFMQTGVDIEIAKLPSSDYAFWALFPLRPGKVSQLHQPIVCSRFDIQWFVNSGSVIEEQDCKNIVGKAAHAVFYNTDKNALRQDFERIKNHVAIGVGL